MTKGRAIDADWLREHYPTMTDINSLLDEHEAKFGWRPRAASLYLRANRLGIHKAPVEGRGNRCERPVFWSKEPEMEQWMLEHDHGQRSDVLSQEFREKFGFGLVRTQIDLFRASHGTGCQRRRSHGGGRKLLPVGTERVSKDGYVVIKVRMHAKVPMSKDNWMLKHVWVYEQTHGKVPEGHVVYFADGDRTNYDPDNLVAVPRKLVGVMNSLGIHWHDADSLKSVIALAEIRCARNDIIASLTRTCPCCGKTFDNQSRRGGANVGSTVCPECGAKGRKPPMKGRRKFDHGEIQRLHNIGWKNEDIANYIGCSRSTVSNVIHNRKERRRNEQGRT